MPEKAVWLASHTLRAARTFANCLCLLSFAGLPVIVHGLWASVT